MAGGTRQRIMALAMGFISMALLPANITQKMIWDGSVSVAATATTTLAATAIR